MPGRPGRPRSKPPGCRRRAPTRASRSQRCTRRSTPASRTRSIFEQRGLPGQFPFTRGIYPTMYRGRLWTMRLYSGWGTAEDTNERFRYLLDHGQTGLSVALDLPTQMGYDSDHPLAHAGDRQGRRLGRLPGRHGADLRGHPARSDPDLVHDQRHRTDPAGDVPGRRRAAGRRPGATARDGPERHPQGVPGAQDLHLSPATVDAAGRRHDRVLRPTTLPKFNPISVCGYHMRQAGLRRRARDRLHPLERRGIRPDADRPGARPSTSSRPRFSFNLSTMRDFFEEIAKHRAARRIWARIMRERFGAKDPRSAR